MNRTAFLRLGMVVLAFMFVGVAHGAAFANGNIVVSRVGTGTGVLNNNATAVFLDEYTTAGLLVQSIPLPTSASGNHRRFTNSGDIVGECTLTRSTDGRYLTLAGYDAAVGTGSVAGQTVASVNRVVAVVDANGSIDTTTALTDAYDTNSIRSVVYDGARLWTGGPSGPGGGTRYVTLGATTSTQLVASASGALNDVHVVNIFNGQLYVSSQMNGYQGISTIGTGLPTTGGQMGKLLPGFPTTVGPSSVDFYFADANTLYVADDRSGSTAGGGIQKWTLSGETWTLAYTLSPAAGVGARGLTGYGATLFATTTNNKLVMVTDTGAGASFTTLVTGAANTALRGVDFAPTPEPATLLALLAAGGVVFARRRR